MEKIERYVEKFFATTKINIRFGMKFDECQACRQAIQEKSDAFHVTALIFNYGYVKGYRACQAEMKKGGVS